MAKNPLTRESVAQFLEVLTPLSPEKAEKLVRDVLRVAEERRREVEKAVGDMARAGRRSAEDFATSVQQEMAKQVSRMATRIDVLEEQVESLARTLESTRENFVALANRVLPTSASQKGSSQSDSYDSEGRRRKSSKNKKKNAKKGRDSGGQSASPSPVTP